MSILTDALIDAKADLCWNHQQQQLKKEVERDCICGQLADMIYLTRQEIAKEIERELCINSIWDGKVQDSYEGDDGCCGVNGEHCEIVKECADIARGNK